MFQAIILCNFQQTLKNDKKPNFGPHFDPFGPDSPPASQIFSQVLTPLELDIVPSYHPIQFKEKLMKRT